MKSLITYYSYSGNTDKVAKVFRKVLGKKGQVDTCRLRPKDEIKTFFGQCKAAFMRKRAELEDGAIFAVTSYELILIGSPVWAFAPTPAINTYLDKLFCVKGKRVVIFLTSGSGAGVKRCFDNIKMALETRGVFKVHEVNIQDRRVSDETFVASSLEKIL